MRIVIDENILQLAVNTLAKRPYEEVSGIIQALSSGGIPFDQAYETERQAREDRQKFEDFKRALLEK